MTINLPSLDTPPAGAIRFNSDSMKLEVYRGGIGIGTTNQTGGWWTIDNASVGIGTSSISGSSGGSGARGVFGGGKQLSGGTNFNIIDYVNISTTGNAIDFGDALDSRAQMGGLASNTRGVFAGGFQDAPPGNPTNVIQYLTISSTGNTLDFGDLSQANDDLGACASSTRGIFGGGSRAGTTNTIEYITIASTGNVQDFGDLLYNGRTTRGCSSSTRGIFGGGISINNINFITIASTGNASDFGDLLTGTYGRGSCANSTRGLFFGGYVTPTVTNNIEYITISSTGNGTDFGDLSVARIDLRAASSSTRGICEGGYTTSPAPTTYNVIDYVTIMSLGNAIDFGDLTQARYYAAACSNAHGGL